jgi:uracil permease
MEVVMTTRNEVLGYLPDERPPLIGLIFFALQQIVVMFPATVLVALITGFHVSTTIFASGLATLGFILITGRQIPLYYGSSFSYIAAIASIMSAEQFASYSLNDKISIAQFGIVMSGFVSILAGYIINKSGKEKIDKVLPATVTGSIAIIIGLSLAANAMTNAASFPEAAQSNPYAGSWAWTIAIITLLSTILYSVYLRGKLSQLPLHP